MIDQGPTRFLFLIEGGRDIRGCVVGIGKAMASMSDRGLSCITAFEEGFFDFGWDTTLSTDGVTRATGFAGFVTALATGRRGTNRLEESFATDLIGFESTEIDSSAARLAGWAIEWFSRGGRLEGTVDGGRKEARAAFCCWSFCGKDDDFD